MSSLLGEAERGALSQVSFPCSSGCGILGAGTDEVFRPVRHGRSEKVRPAGEGTAHEKSVVTDAVFFIHACSRRKLETARGQKPLRPLAAGIVEFMPVPYASQSMEGVGSGDAGSHITEPLRTAEKTRARRQNPMEVDSRCPKMPAKW